MPIFDRITRHSVSVLRSNLHDASRSLNLRLESGGTASISFVRTPPDDFLRFSGSATRLFMTTDQFDDVYRVLRHESPVFFTALDLFGIKVGHVHSELVLDDAGMLMPDEDGEPSAEAADGASEDEVEAFREFLDQVSPEDFLGPESGS